MLNPLLTVSHRQFERLVTTSLPIIFLLLILHSQQYQIMYDQSENMADKLFLYRMGYIILGYRIYTAIILLYREI